MHATRTPPENYTRQTQLDLSSKRAALLLNLGAVILTLGMVLAFNHVMSLLRPGVCFLSITRLPLMLLGFVVVIILHELIHGLFFWIFTRQRPVFAFKGSYAFAAAPDWYLPRDQFVIVGLAPLVLISLAAALIFAIFSLNATTYFIMLSGILNAASSFGDLVTVIWVQRRSPEALVRDQGDRFLVLEQEP